MKSGITLWIILGLLVGVVVIFLVVASILDRKKTKKLKIKKQEEEAEQKAAEGKIAIAINMIVEFNNNLLKKFVPSVGKLKMSDIKVRAKKAFNMIEHSREFKLLQVSDNKETITNFNNLKKTNSNLWDNHCKDTIKYFLNLEKKIDSEEKEYRKTTKKKMREVFK